MNSDTNKWAMALHLSVFAGYIVPGAGFVAPIVIWLVKKDDMPELDTHGRNVANAMISFLIYGLLCLLLTFVVIGVPMLFVLGLLGIIFPIVAAVKAADGVAWPYPGTMKFL